MSAASESRPVTQIRIDRTRLVIKKRTIGPFSGNGWANLEKGFKNEAELQSRYDELIKTNQYEEG